MCTFCDVKVSFGASKSLFLHPFYFFFLEKMSDTIKHTLILETKEVLRIGGKDILQTLEEHTPVSATAIKWPTTFKVLITETEDSVDLMYFHIDDDKKPFLHMDWTDAGFCATVGMFRAIAELGQKPVAQKRNRLISRPD